MFCNRLKANQRGALETCWAQIGDKTSPCCFLFIPFNFLSQNSNIVDALK